MVWQDQAAVYLGLGSNLGDRYRSLSLAVETLDRHCEIQVDIADGMASLYETSPVGGPAHQARYLNSALRLFTKLTPIELLTVALGVEQSIGRIRGEPWGSRVIDVDVLFFGDCIVDDQALQIPHPRLHLRRFVLEPLHDIAPALRHPVLHKTITQLACHARRIQAHQQVECIGNSKWFQAGVPKPKQ